MSIHRSVVNVLVSLGYTRTNGCCHGVSLRWLEACLLGEEHLFNGRMDKIAKDGTSLVQRIDAAKEKKGQHLTMEDKELLDVLAFYDSLELYHSPHVHFSLFNAPLIQDDVDIISKVASSAAILSRGGLARIYSEPVIHKQHETKAYLDGLGVLIEQACAQSKEPLGIVLSSINHAIALTYTPGQGWKFMDINQYPSKSFMINKTNVLAKHIMAGFRESKSPYRAFNVSIFTTRDHLGLLNIKETFDSFNKSSRMTKEIATREAEEGINLARIAAQEGHTSVIAQLIKMGVKVNTPYTASADNLRQFAITRGEKVIKRMNDFIDQQLVLSPQSQTISMMPFHIAVVMGHREILKLLEQVQNERLNANPLLMEQPQSVNDKTIGDGYSFFSFLVKEDVASNGVNSQPQQVWFDVNQAEPRKRKVKMLDDQPLEEIENKRTRYR